VIVVLCLDDGDGDVGFVIKDVIGALRFATGDELAPLNRLASLEITVFVYQGCTNRLILKPFLFEVAMLLLLLCR
jgi:hypothetical protein